MSEPRDTAENDGGWEVFTPPRARPGKAEHGSSGALYSQGCRCDLCREANTARAARYRAKRSATTRVTPPGSGAS